MSNIISDLSLHSDFAAFRLALAQRNKVHSGVRPLLAVDEYESRRAADNRPSCSSLSVPLPRSLQSNEPKRSWIPAHYIKNVGIQY